MEAPARDKGRCGVSQVVEGRLVWWSSLSQTNVDKNTRSSFLARHACGEDEEEALNLQLSTPFSKEGKNFVH